MKTNREKNTEHEQKELMRVRPKPIEYNYKPLEDVVRKWVIKNEQT
jgi:hypothetical protein